MSIYRNKGR